MDLQQIIEAAEKQANGNVVDYLVTIYWGLRKEKEKEVLLFQEFVSQHHRRFINNKDSESLILKDWNLGQLFPKYETLTDGFIDYLVSENLPVDEFYTRLWEFIHNKEIFHDELASITGFLMIAKHTLLPYYYLPAGLQMSNDEYREYIKNLEPQIERIHFIVKRTYSQKTEKASAFLSVLEEVNDKKERAVLLSRLLDLMIEQRLPEQNE